PARFLRSPGARGHRPLAAGVAARAAAPAAAVPAAGAALAVGLAGARRHPHPGPGAGAAPPFGVPLRAGPRAVPPAARRPLARVLARSGAALPGLARRARLLPRRGPPAQGRAARADRLI